MIDRAATWEDIERFDSAHDVRASYGVSRWFRCIEDRGAIQMVYGSDGEYLYVAPARTISRPIAFARATKRAYLALRGSGLRSRLALDEPHCHWAWWLGVTLHDGWAIL